jgi:hypothetical protein
LIPFRNYGLGRFVFAVQEVLRRKFGMEEPLAANHYEVRKKFGRPFSPGVGGGGTMEEVLTGRGSLASGAANSGSRAGFSGL